MWDCSEVQLLDYASSYAKSHTSKTYMQQHFLAVFTSTFYPNDAGPFPGIDRSSRLRDSPTYRTFIIASSSEWGMVLAIQVFVMSLAMELRNCYGYASRIIFEHDEAEKGKMEVLG
ncbi:unnamed protein product [Cylicocyclus nassatus]|uniref:Uncharacterized protein n=1 Tax=Cylicocyclus nassatus TaxID=53992 RepID=A0AA36M915_CYLNA|nr:unnamed protein product [Cylicocyclus nassatus]